LTSAVTRAPFGTMPDGTAVDAYTLLNAAGLSARVLTLGGIVQSVRTPDRAGALGNIVLGYPHLDGYLGDTDYMGALIGRFAGRIAGGVIDIDGVTHALSRNAADTTLHGGAVGFDKAIWRAGVEAGRLILNHLSPDGDQGFPGALRGEATFELTDDNALRIAFTATASRTTIVNPTHHGYWNLAGGGLIRDHWLQVEANGVLETEGMIPTGALRAVRGTALDLRRPRRLGEVIDATGGLDHTFVLAGPRARLTHPASGRVLEIWTEEPGLTVYTANAFRGAYPRYSGVALEAEHFPDSPHHPAFPSTLLRPGEVLRSTTVYRFGLA
jgi:aldose 1-epimerase